MTHSGIDLTRDSHFRGQDVLARARPHSTGFRVLMEALVTTRWIHLGLKENSATKHTGQTSFRWLGSCVGELERPVYPVLRALNVYTGTGYRFFTGTGYPVPVDVCVMV